MRRRPIESSNLSEVGYSAKTKTLEIAFQGGAVYQYSGVPESVYRALLEADSAGTYFAQNIRTSYTFRRIGGK